MSVPCIWADGIHASTPNFKLTHTLLVKVLVCCPCGPGFEPRPHATIAWYWSCHFVWHIVFTIYVTYVLDFRLNRTLCAGITRPERCQFKCIEVTKNIYICWGCLTWHKWSKIWETWKTFKKERFSNYCLLLDSISTIFRKY